jgi:hypothetical protein
MTLQTSNAAAHGVDLVALPKFGYFVSDPLDHSCEIQSKNSGERHACVGGVSRANLRVERIHSTGKHTNQDLMSTESRARHPGHDEWTVRTLYNEGLHFCRTGHHTHPFVLRILPFCCSSGGCKHKETYLSGLMCRR